MTRKRSLSTSNHSGDLDKFQCQCHLRSVRVVAPAETLACFLNLAGVRLWPRLCENALISAIGGLGEARLICASSRHPGGVSRLAS